MFQSTPVITGGRNRPLFGTSYGHLSFNPRPSLLAGETRTGCNHYVNVCGCFNPRPSLLAGETGAKFDGEALFHCFNPRPSLLAGETCTVALVAI